MTDYYTRRGQKWRREKAERQGKSLLALVVVVILVFAAANGLLKSISFKNSIQNSKWDGKAPFVSALGSSPASLFIYNPDTKNIVFAKFSDDLYFASGESEEPLTKLGEVIKSREGDKFSKVLSLNIGSKIENYILPKEGMKIDEVGTQEFFKDFASIGKPLSILAGGAFKSMDTNIERFDALRLWWQIKGLRLNQLKIADFSGVSEEVINNNDSKVLGVDTETMQFEIRRLLESRALKESGLGVKIINSSGSADAGVLAASFITSSGLEVLSSDRAETIEGETKLIASDTSGYAQEYLAELFDCDIVTAQKSDFAEEGSEKEITLFLGRDFADFYFK